MPKKTTALLVAFFILALPFPGETQTVEGQARPMPATQVSSGQVVPPATDLVSQSPARESDRAGPISSAASPDFSQEQRQAQADPVTAGTLQTVSTPSRSGKSDEPPEALSPAGVTEVSNLPVLEPGQTVMNAPAGAELAPSLFGLSGVFRTVSARNGPLNSARIGAHAGYYYLSEEWDGAAQSHLEGRLHLAYTLRDDVELHLDALGTGHRIIPRDPRLPQEFLQTLGDLAFGGKYVYKFYDYLWAGGALDFRFYTKIRSMGARWGSFSLLPLGLVTFDGREHPKLQWPVVAHLNLGYFYDNSYKVLLNGANSGLAFRAGITASRLMALNVKPGDQVILNTALEFPQGPYTVFFEYTTEQEVNAKLGRGVYKGHWNQSAQRFTPGVRWNVWDRLILDFAVDISYGLTGDFVAAGVPARATTPYQFWLGLTYSFDPEARKVVDSRGFVKGIVVDAETGEPIGGAVVHYPGLPLTRQVTNGEDGNFKSFPLPPGTAKIRIVKEKYEPVVITPTVLSKETITEKILLRKIDEGGQLVGALVGSVLDSAAKPVAATLSFVDQEIAGTRSNPSDGSFVKILPPGQYKVKVEAEGYETKIFLVPIEARKKTKVVFELPPAGVTGVGAIAGVLTDAEGKPLSGTIRFPEANLRELASNPQTGEFFATLPPGRYKIEVSAQGYGAREYLIPVEAGKKTRVDIRLTPSAAVGAIAGRLLAEGDKPLAGTVRFLDEKIGTIPVDPSTGSFFRVLPVGTYEVELSAPGYAKKRVSVQILERKKTVQDFYLEGEGGNPALIKVVADRIEPTRPILLPKNGLDLKPQDTEILDAIVALLNQRPTLRLTIRAYTDDEGPAKANLRATQAQAEAVARYITQKGIDPKRVTAVGGGEEKPLFPNDTPENRARNRRVEFSIR